MGANEVLSTLLKAGWVGRQRGCCPPPDGSAHPLASPTVKTGLPQRTVVRGREEKHRPGPGVGEQGGQSWGLWGAPLGACWPKGAGQPDGSETPGSYDHKTQAPAASQAPPPGSRGPTAEAGAPTLAMHLVSDEDLLCSTGNSAQYLAITYNLKAHAQQRRPKAAKNK